MENVFEGYRISQSYGCKPFGSGQQFHSGIDLVKAYKAPIHAFTEGTVLYAGMGKAGTGLGDYGNVVVVRIKTEEDNYMLISIVLRLNWGRHLKKARSLAIKG